MTSGPGELHETVEERLDRVGQRYTPNRRALVDALVRARGPVAMGDLLVGKRALPQSSAYRNLAVLEQAGVIRRVITDDDFARFELDEGLTEHHHHLVCSNCGRVEDVAIPVNVERSIGRSLDRLAKGAGFASVGHRLDLIGRCRSCA
ncbi:MAG TPA: Fur family transcriptional regulator [Actinomycetota bacterium]|jgi:Fe2+ or Zn2+ uptake regulation protein|nr:Fur family transcriptional regulator [Actinomycetota bacterium]